MPRMAVICAGCRLRSRPGLPRGGRLSPPWSQPLPDASRKAVAGGKSAANRALLLADQAIADARLSDQQFWLCRVRFQFLPQMRQVNAQVVRLLDIVRPPDLAEYLPVREHLPGVLDEKPQQRVFRGGQLHFFG